MMNSTQCWNLTFLHNLFHQGPYGRPGKSGSPGPPGVKVSFEKNMGIFNTKKQMETLIFCKM